MTLGGLVAAGGIPMSCDSWRRKIIDRIADELPEREAIELEQHLADCADCAAEAQRLERLLEATAPREEWIADARIEDRLLRHMRSNRARPSLLVRWRAAWLRPLPAYSLIVLGVIAIAGGFWLGQLSETGSGARRIAAPGGAATSPQAVSPAMDPAGHALPPSREADEGASCATALSDRSRASRHGDLRFVAVPSDAFGWGSAPDSL
ncbi:MAG: hypothetical protein GF330_07035 [Candidatus Eisenbacteria bacterium]|nr:hypothetical protein [Candidatus Eisenbacteria bacterium]